MNDLGEVSDGYHTFDELYNHRHLLFIALMRSNPEMSWRARVHEDGSMYEGWFVAGMELSTGNISYHLPVEMWELLDFSKITTMKNAPKFDGHTPNMVIERLRKWATPEKYK